ncbi:MAG: hypothetical protein U0822_13420 [Anaerolineae bacterium]
MSELTADDKEFLFQTVLQIGLAVMTASPSGLEGTFDETETMVEAPVQLAKNFPNSTLIQSILEQNRGGEEDVVDEDEEETTEEAGEDVEASEGEEEETADEPDRPEGPDQILAEAVTMCRQAADLLNGVEAEEASQYKAWALACGTAVAQASKEGGFLGFRKKLVTDDERVALEQIAQALQAPMPKLP